MPGLNEADCEPTDPPVVERRWWGHYFRPITAADADDPCHLEGEWEGLCPLETWLFEYVVDSGETFTPSTWWPWIPTLRELLNSKGFELDGGPVPEKTSPHRFLGRLAEGAPRAARKAAWEGGWPGDPMLVGAVLIEALPLGADELSVEMAVELIGPPPIASPDLVPGYDEPLEGDLAEWATQARATADILELAGPLRPG